MAIMASGDLPGNQIELFRRCAGSKLTPPDVHEPRISAPGESGNVHEADPQAPLRLMKGWLA
jgi:hypothetical protein